MSIKKCIMNYFDKATNAMVPFHPQTESGAITDWHESVIGSLASKVLPTVVSELTTDSVMGKLIKMLLTASGVKYSINTNGYVCLGSFFGGLIIQWGSNCYGWTAFPVAFAQFRKLVTNHQGVTWMQTQARESNTLNGFTLDAGNNDKNDCDAQWIAVGK